MLKSLESSHPGITLVNKDAEGYVIISENKETLDDFMKRYFQ